MAAWIGAKQLRSPGAGFPGRVYQLPVGNDGLASLALNPSETSDFKKKKKWMEECGDWRKPLTDDLQEFPKMILVAAHISCKMPTMGLSSAIFSSVSSSKVSCWMVRMVRRFGGGKGQLCVMNLLQVEVPCVIPMVSGCAWASSRMDGGSRKFNRLSTSSGVFQILESRISSLLHCRTQTSFSPSFFLGIPKPG